MRKEQIMDQVFKVLSDFNRIRILNMLLKQKWCVTEMSEILDLSVSSVSRHLSKLRLVGMVNAEQDAQWVHNIINKEFYVQNKLLFDYIESISNRDEILAEDIARMNRYIKSELTCRDICDCPQKIKNILNGK
jgi:ArsR family transcriptional regulator, arsenate/arsenite/antimonite-responsive transcriptional repressor